MLHYRWKFALCLLWFSLESQGRCAEVDPADPVLSITMAGAKVEFKRSELLLRSDLETINVPADASYPGRTMSYKAIRAAKLFAGLKIPPQAVIQFQCSDGFSAPLNRDRLLNEDPLSSVAFVAIEPAASPWPAVKPGGASAGPFYLVWPQPKLSQIGPEEWPFQLTGFTIKENLRLLYPHIFPAARASAEVQQGFALFTKNCFPCHTINREGSTEIGPDLNVPFSPTEYFNRRSLRRLIRNPQELRHYPKSRMSSFPESSMPDAQLDELIAYLTHMAKHKVAATPKHH